MAKIGGGNTKKIGRNKEKCKRYRDRFTRERNKIKSLRKQIKVLPVSNLQRTILEKRLRELKKMVDKKVIEND